MSEHQYVLVERRGRINICTINRPEARNAVNWDVTLAMAAALDLAEADDDVWAHVITGAGDKAFCAGADLKAVARAREGTAPARASAERHVAGFAGITDRKFVKPVIAAVNGFALGGGTEICCNCDMVVAEEHAAFGLTEVLRGIVAGAGGMQRLVRRMPPNIAMEYLLTGRHMPAQRAAEVGFVNSIVPRGQAVQAAVRLAEEVCQAAPLSVRITKAVARSSFTDNEDAAGGDLSDTIRRMMASEDTLEGLRAFAEKRSPTWKGR